MVKIRLQRKGRKKQPFYHIVIADARAPRDGRFIEKIGYYNPMTSPATIELDRDKAYEWLTQGAQPTDTARAILRFKGVLYRKHLERGVKKGALTEEAAAEMHNDFITAKDERTAKRFEEEALKKLARLAEISGVAPPPPPPPVVEVVKEVVEEATEVVADTAENVKAAAETVVETAAEVVAEVTEEVKEVAVEVKEKVKEVVADVVEKVKVKEVVADVVEKVKVKEVVADVIEKVKEVVADVVEKTDDAPKA